MRVLLAEDNARLASLIVGGLSENGFAVDPFDRLDDVQAAVGSVRYDLLLLDLGMPDGDGITFLRWLRRSGSTVPVLVITARSALDDKVIGLDSGADDYLVKPFEMKELVARCRALLRRPDSCLGTVLNFENLAFDSAVRALQVDGHHVHLPPREADLLELLLRRAGRVVAKPSIEEALYALAAEVTPNALEAVVSRLRRALKQSGARVRLHTVHGVGYMLAAVPA